MDNAGLQISADDRIVTNGSPNIIKPSVNADGPADGPLKVYSIRWLVLGLFVAHSLTNAFQWIQYSIISNVVADYYGVGTAAINWTSMIYMVVYIPLIFPAAWILDKKGLKFVVLIGSFGTMLGAWIKCGSVAQDRFYVTFIGQTICAVSQLFILGIPPRLAAVWFGPTQVSTACAIGVFGNQLGVALGFLVPPELVPSSSDPAEVAHGLQVMFYLIAAICTVIFILICFFFKAGPKTSPSAAAEKSAAKADDDNFFRSISRLLHNVGYILMLITYGINVGVFYAISTLLNQIVLQYFPGEEQNAGRIGLVIVLSGMVGSVVTGIWLDRTHKFKETTLGVYILSFVGMVAYTFIFYTYEIWTVFVIAAFLGFFMTGYLPLGFEFASEITYPESEGTTSGLLNAAAQFFGIIFTLLAAFLLDNVSDLSSNLTMSGALLIGAILTALVKSDLKRQAAQQTVKSAIV